MPACKRTPSDRTSLKPSRRTLMEAAGGEVTPSRVRAPSRTGRISRRPLID